MRRRLFNVAVKPTGSGLRLYGLMAALISCGPLYPFLDVPAAEPVHPARDLPPAIEMSRGAGEGMLLFVEVATETGEIFPCAVDTGSPGTTLPASLEPRLGKRLGSRRFSTLDSRNEVEHLYAAPRLYLGKTQLVTDAQVGASGNFGVLGMDCLRHYCIQLDFEARTVRFLGSNQVKVAELGKPFALARSRYATIQHAGFFQEKQAALLIDTGCPFDGYLSPRTFKRAVREQMGQSLPFSKDGVVRGTAPGVALFPQCVWENERYTNLIIGKGPNLVGLRFLGRHLVTFDFPRAVLYLKRTGAEDCSQKGS